MGENTAISWCHSTWNPWIGCTRVSPGCQHCYAEAFARRYGKAEWGPTAERVRTSAANWRKPILWNRKAAAEGVRRRVFCASLADVFEDNPQVETWRAELFDLIIQTPHLDWLLLTKRPENIIPALRKIKVLTYDNLYDHLWLRGHFPNVWLGTTVENQAAADKRIPALIQVPATVRFLSCEPLLGPVDLSGTTCDTVWIDAGYAATDPGLGDLVREEGWPIHWVIAGGESGPQARPMNPYWVRLLRDQCVDAGVPFHFKQWGEWRPAEAQDDPSVREYWDWGMNRVGVKAAGRLLDGCIWDQFPAIQGGRP